MAVYKLSGVGDLYVLSCASCGTSFGMSLEIEKQRRADGRNFYCPHGHILVFRDNELDRTKKELEATKKSLEVTQRQKQWAEEGRTRERAEREKVERQRNSTKGHVTRLRKRLAAGQCPCCDQKFQDLEDHIATKHPRYRPKEST